ncbi:hypothetical protein Taro_026155 [Colocasia esculenta]|uniref:Uncharacterized protein n=1 Tax=Colocasia esculenta TaxID=4460 RepID=A0A843VMR7_COLES|nr:hypothetical protein [Colocasia esculenta]
MATWLSDPEVRSRRTLVWVATGREQNATMGCEERDGAVRSGSAIVTGHFVAIRKRRVCCRYKTSERGLSGRRVRRVAADATGKKMISLWSFHSSSATKSSSTRPQQVLKLVSKLGLLAWDSWKGGDRDSRIAGKLLPSSSTLLLCVQACCKRTNISCKGSVDTTINGVDTMAQSKGRNVKKRSSSVDTSPEQVDTGSSQVDTRDLSQGIVLPVWDSVSAHLKGRSTHSGISVT